MKNTKPSIRFAGFTDDWEERKLGDIYDFSKGKGLPLDSFTISKISPAIAYGHLYTHYSEVISEVLLSSDDQGVMSKSNDLLFPGSSTVPNGTAQANALLLNNIKLGGDIIIGRPKKDSNVMSTFMSYQINSQREKLFPITVGTTITHMYGKDLANLTFLTTSLEEQGKISQLFYQLTKTIALHQRQLDLLKEQKKGFLQKMFPKQGEKVPELRFAEFTDDWEERKLKYVASYRNGKAHEQVEDENGKFTIVNSKFISTDGKVKRNTNEQVEPMFKGELAIVLSDLPNGKALAKVFLVNENEKYTLNQRIAGITPKENCDSKFLSYRMNRHSYFLKFDSGVSQTNLSKPQVEEFVTLYPSFEEQQKIGSFFKQLDDTSALHQRQLDLLKEQKKGYLQKMFV